MNRLCFFFVLMLCFVGVSAQEFESQEAWINGQQLTLTQHNIQLFHQDSIDATLGFEVDKTIYVEHNNSLIVQIKMNRTPVPGGSYTLPRSVVLWLPQVEAPMLRFYIALDSAATQNPDLEQNIKSAVHPDAQVFFVSLSDEIFFPGFEVKSAQSQGNVFQKNVCLKHTSNQHAGDETEHVDKLGSFTFLNESTTIVSFSLHGADVSINMPYQNFSLDNHHFFMSFEDAEGNVCEISRMSDGDVMATLCKANGEKLSGLVVNAGTLQNIMEALEVLAANAIKARGFGYTRAYERAQGSNDHSIEILDDFNASKITMLRDLSIESLVGMMKK